MDLVIDAPLHSGCAAVLRKDSSAIACLVAASSLLRRPFDRDEDGSPFLEEEGEIVSFEALQTILESVVPDVDVDNVHRIYSLLVAATGGEFFEDPDLFVRITGGIVYGDPYHFEEDQNDPLLVEMTWAIYQVDLLQEEAAEEMLSERVAERIVEITEENPADLEILNEIEPDFAGGVEEFYEHLLRFRTAELRKDLRACGATEEFIDDLLGPVNDHS